MEILGLIPQYRSDESDAIVRLTHQELNIILTGLTYGKTPAVGSKVDICDRYRSVVKIEEMACAASKVPGSLRAFADTFDLVVERAARAIDPTNQDISDI